MMACRLIGNNSSWQPMLNHCFLDHRKQTTLKFQSKYNHFHSRTLTVKMSPTKCWLYCLVLNGLKPFFFAEWYASITKACRYRCMANYIGGWIHNIASRDWRKMANILHTTIAHFFIETKLFVCRLKTFILKSVVRYNWKYVSNKLGDGMATNVQ